MKRVVPRVFMFTSKNYFFAFLEANRERHQSLESSPKKVTGMKKKVHKDEEDSLLVVIDFDRTHFHTFA